MDTNDIRKKFKNHKANISGTDELTVLDWNNGSSRYAIRYIMDRNKIYITGDIGSAILTLTEKADLKTLYNYELPYFISKLTCSTAKYIYDENLAKEELINKGATNDQINDIMSYFDHVNGLTDNSNLYNTLLAIDNDYYEWVDTLGRKTDPCIEMWLTGLKMAYEQISN